LKALGEAADVYLGYAGGLYQSPRYWDLSRLSLWNQVEGPPPSENGKTRLPPPPGDLLGTLKGLLEAGSFKEAVDAAEDKTGVFIFWLDLHRISFKGLEGLGYKASAGVLEARVRSFTAGFPEVTSLAFDDGTPFASPDVLEWLASTGSGSGPAVSDVGKYDVYLQGDSNKALSDLGDPKTRPRTGRDMMLSRAAEIRLHRRTGRVFSAAALARWAVSETERLDLCSYDPEVASKAMQAAAVAFEAAGAEYRADYVKALGLLAQCGPRAALELPPQEAT
jgi:type VI secretion system protein VasJ